MDGNEGGSGGGSITIYSANLSNNGVISADGFCGEFPGAGGGSGGSIILNVSYIEGTGNISANGGCGLYSSGTVYFVKLLHNFRY